MGAFDVVLTTYEVLGSDLHHLPSELGTQRRSSTRQAAKKYPFIASPLVYTTFWRVCMDEAQVGVENARLSPAMTVAQLRAVSTWIVTGTPFSTSIADLYGAFKFLRVKPFDDDENGLAFFKTIVEKCFAGGAVERVLDMLLWNGQHDAAGERTATGGGLLWRTAKSDVLDQLDVPAQHNDVVWCRFSRIERHFYETQAAKVLARVRSDAMDESEMLDDALWNELLQLRQLCCHPVVSSSLARAHVRTVDDLLADMLHNALAVYITARRRYVDNQNALAAIHAIDKDHSRAIALYLDSYDMLHEDLSAMRPQDEFVLLHIAVNLAEFVHFMIGQPVVASAATRLVDGDLANGHARTPTDQVPRLEAIRCAMADNCWASYVNLVGAHDDVAALEHYAADIRASLVAKEASEHKKALVRARKGWARTKPYFLDASWTPVGSTPPVSQPPPWWKEVLMAVERDCGVQALDFADTVRASLTATNKTWSIQFASSFQSVDGLRRAITDEWGALASQRRALKNALAAYCNAAPTETSLAEWRGCLQCTSPHLRTVDPFCDSCGLERKLACFRHQLVGRGDLSQDKQRQIVYKRAFTEAPLALLGVFKVIASAAQAIGQLEKERSKEVIENETSKWDAIKEDFTTARALLDAQRRRFQVLDRVATAVKRVSLTENSANPHAEHPSLYNHFDRTVVAADVAHNLRVLEAANQGERRSLDGLCGKWRFIQSLDAQRREEKQQQRPERVKCAVCWQEMKPERIMLPCAHSFCHACVYNVAGTSSAFDCGGRCPMCRCPFAMDDVTLVCPDTKTLKQDTHVEYGCKVDAIVGRVVALEKGEPRVKCLLFSQWQSMLAMTTSVLEERGVKCFIFTTKRELPATLNAFKTFVGDAPSVLALPYRHGSNGLNIMEATHVLLAEPPLNAAIEKQAVSRVYRIGQTRETIVHRFVVRESVEERIYRARHAPINQGIASCSRRVGDYKTSLKEKNGEERISMEKVRALLTPTLIEEEEKTEERPMARPLWMDRVVVSA